MADVLIALGGNVGDVRATFRKAIANICGMTQAALLARSSDYATPPWGDEQQARFINAAIEIETDLDPHALLLCVPPAAEPVGGVGQAVLMQRAGEKHGGQHREQSRDPSGPEF